MPPSAVYARTTRARPPAVSTETRSASTNRDFVGLADDGRYVRQSRGGSVFGQQPSQLGIATDEWQAARCRGGSERSALPGA